LAEWEWVRDGRMMATDGRVVTSDGL
jgi:hypothetical protein